MEALSPVIKITLGFIVGFMVGLTGVGGAALMTPSLVIFLRMNPVTAVATDLLYAIATKIVGSVQHLRQKTVEPVLAVAMGLSAAPTAVLGAYVITMFHRNEATKRLTEQYLTLGLGIILIGVSSTMLWHTCSSRRAKKGKALENGAAQAKMRLSPHMLILAIITGAVIGLIVGMTSVGGGCLAVTALVFFYRLPMRKVVGTNIVVAAILVISAGITHFLKGNADVGTAGLLLVGSIPGVILGSKATMRAPGLFLRLLVGLAIAASGVTLVVKGFGGAP